jgi:hypothetical protein
MSTASVRESEPLGAADPRSRYRLDALGCPHAEARASALIQVQSQAGEAMDLCIPCKTMFDEFLARWAGGELHPVEIRARMRQRGYDDADVKQFLFDLEQPA